MRMRTGATRRRLLALAAAMLATVALAGGISAHEHREVGEYTFTVGFINEPAIIEQPNGLELRIEHGHGDDAEPIEGLANTLDAEIIYGDERLPLEIRAQYNTPGAYTADVIPTEIGAYTFRIYGTIEGTQVDESFTGGPDTFSEVAGINAMTFPNQVETVGSVQSTANDASDTAGTAMMLAIGGIAFGLLGTALAVFAFMRVSAMNRQRGVTTGAVAQDATD